MRMGQPPCPPVALFSSAGEHPKGAQQSQLPAHPPIHSLTRLSTHMLTSGFAWQGRWVGRPSASLEAREASCTTPPPPQWCVGGKGSSPVSRCSGIPLLLTPEFGARCDSITCSAKWPRLLATVIDSYHFPCHFTGYYV